MKHGTDSSSGTSLPSIRQTRYAHLFPHTLTVCRVAAIPLFCTFWQHRQSLAAMLIFLLMMLSDVFDGQLARQLDVASRAGAYLDVTADFLVVFSIFSLFVMQGLYAPWVAFLIIVMFLQFIVTSIRFSRVMYDPVGKHFGGFLFGVIGMTIICPKEALCFAFSMGVLGMASISLTSRAIALLAHQKEDRKNV